MTPDVNRLQLNLTILHDVLEQIEFEFIGDPQWAEPSDTSYLSEKDRANPDIMSNVEAMNEINKFIAWFGRDQDGYVGLWQKQDNSALERAPVVRLDTEGQYSIVAATVPDYIAISVDDDSFSDARESLIAVGFKVSATQDDIWNALDVSIDPNELRNELYNQGRVRRGLDPI